MPERPFEPIRVARLQAAMRRHVDTGRLPGLVTLVSHRGRVQVDAMGTMAFGGRKPIRRDTLFRLASMTKPITAVGAMILVEECKLRLDDPVDGWLPELADRKVLRAIDGPLDDTVPARRPITLRDLLTFRAGYGEVFFVAPTSPLMQAQMQSKLCLAAWPFTCSADEVMKGLGAMPLAHQPGERWLYHMGAEILGVLIARAAGVPLSAFLRQRIFEPLGMKDTSFVVSEPNLDRLPTCYGVDFPKPDLVVLDEARGSRYGRPPTFESGGGGLVSTVDDMFAFGTMLLNGGAHGRTRVLSRPTVELMSQDQLTAEQKAASPFFEGYWSTRSWGLGLGVVTRRGDLSEVPGRFGWDGAFGTSFYVDPKEKLVGVLMTQRRPDVLAIADFINDFWTSAYQLIDD